LRVYVAQVQEKKVKIVWYKPALD